MAHFTRAMVPVLIVVAFFVGLSVSRTKVGKTLTWYDCHGAQCDLDSYVWEREWDASQNTIATMRRCHSIFVQKENEVLGAFVARIPKSAVWPCMILRKSPQPHAQISGDNWKNSTWMGGTFGEASK